MNCDHGVIKRKSRNSLLNKNKAELAQKKIKLLECQMIFAKNSLKQYKQLEKECLGNNQRIIEKIENDECLSHEQIKILLKKFERLKVTAINLNSRFNDKSELESILVTNDQLSMELQLDKMSSQISEVDLKIIFASQEKNYLQSYLDNDYKVKCDQIEKSKNELDEVCIQQEKYLNSLMNFLGDKVNHIIDDRNQLINDKTNKAIDKYLDTDKEIKYVFFENCQIKKLIISYNDLYKIMESNIKNLKKENIIKQKNQVIAPIKKCLPDTKVKLNIEKMTNLPI